MMTLYEITKKYGSGKGEGMMWKTVDVISKAVEESMPEEARKKLVREIYEEMSDGHYDEFFAMEDISKMFYTDRNGKEHLAPYWSVSTMSDVYDGIKSEIRSYNFWDFAVTLNMVASDNWCMLERWFPDMTESERNTRLVEMALNWLKDDDAKHPDSKIWHYLNG